MFPPSYIFVYFTLKGNLNSDRAWSKHSTRYVCLVAALLDGIGLKGLYAKGKSSDSTRKSPRHLPTLDFSGQGEGKTISLNAVIIFI